MKLDDIPQDIEPRVGDILEIEQGDVCFEVRIIGITADGYLCEQDNVQGAILLEGTGLDEADATDIEDFLRSGGKIQQLPYRNARKEKSAHYRLASRHIGGAGHEQTKGKLAGLRGRAAAVNVSGTGKAVVGEEDIEESGLQYYTGVKKHGEKYMKLAAKAGREGASQEELGRLKDRYSKAEKTKESVEQDVAESTEQSLQKKIQAKRDALGLAREQRRARGQHQQGQREIKLQAEIDELSNQLTQIKKQDVAEAGPFSYGYKKPRKGSVAYWAEKKRKEQEKGKPPIEPKDQMVGVAKVTKAVSEGSDNNVYFEVDSEKAYNHIMKKFRSVINWDGDTMVAPQKYWGAIQELAYSAGGEAIEVGNEQGVAEGSHDKKSTVTTFVTGCDWNKVVEWLEKNIGQTTLKSPNYINGWHGQGWALFLNPSRYEPGKLAFQVRANTDLSEEELKSQIEMFCKGVAEDISSTKKKISKYEELALAANRAGDDAKCKQYQQKIQVLKQKMSQGVAEGLLNEVTQGVEHSEWADNVRDVYPGVKIIKKRTEDGRHIKSQAILNGQLVGQYNMNTGVGTFKAPKQQGVAEASWTAAASMHAATRKRDPQSQDPKHNFRVGDEVTTKDGKSGKVVFVDGEKIQVKGTNSYYPDRVTHHTASELKKGVAEGYTGRETKDGTWRVFKDGQAVAVAGPFNSRDEAHAWIKNHKQGVSEAKSLKKRVRVVQGEHAGKTGWIREIKHGIHSTAPKRYYVDIDGGGQADNLPASALRLLKDQSDSQKGMAEGEQALNEYSFAEKQTYMRFLAAKVQKYGPQSLKPEERAELVAYLQAQKMAKENAGSSDDNQFSLGGKIPATNEIPQDSTAGQDKVQAMVAQMKQRTIDSILDIKPKWERSNLKSKTAAELNQILRDIQSGEMTEAEYQGRKVALGKPMAGDVKKSKVYVRKPNGKVVKVNFGDKKMKIKKSNPARRKSFRARHNCQNPGPRWRARYWSCRAW